MRPSESVTQWIDQLKAGDADAAQRLWEVYFARMVGLARRKLEGAPRAAADEEDVALSAFKSFCMGAQEGRFTQLLDRENLWPLLMAIIANKSIDLIRGQNRQKRGGTGHPQNETDPDNSPAPLVASSLSDLISREPTPEAVTEISDQLQALLLRLDRTGDPDLRRIALLKLEGFKTQEIASKIGCVSRSIERKTKLITRIWEQSVEF